MKHLLQSLLILSVAPLLANCSSHPEIKPYEAPEVRQEDFTKSTLANDAVFEEAISSGQPFDMTSGDIPMDTPSAIAPEKPLPVATETPALEPEKVKPSPTRHSASQLKNGYYIFASDCVMRASPDAGSVGAGQVAAGKKLWLDVHSPQWLKAYKKSGPVYISASCVK
jgi:hypothetical protein